MCELGDGCMLADGREWEDRTGCEAGLLSHRVKSRSQKYRFKVVKAGSNETQRL